MKKLNLLSRADMKKIMGGTELPAEPGIGGDHACDDWAKAETSVCFNCCMTVKDVVDCTKACYSN